MARIVSEKTHRQRKAHDSVAHTTTGNGHDQKALLVELLNESRKQTQDDMKEMLEKAGIKVQDSEYDLTDYVKNLKKLPEQQRKMLKKTLALVGGNELYAKLSDEEYKDGWIQSGKNFAGRAMTFGDFGLMVLGAGLALVVWDGIAYKMDINLRPGWFGGKKTR